MATRNFYPRSAEHLEELIKYLELKYSKTGFEVQTLKAKEDELKGYIFQVRKSYRSELGEIASKVTGLDIAATAKIKQVDDSLDVEVGGGKWLDKAAVAGFAAFVAFSILIIPAGIGAAKQHLMLKELVEDIDRFLKAPARSGRKDQKEDDRKELCPGCGRPVSSDMKFCSNCGRKLE
jgi:hypothetical protein